MSRSTRMLFLSHNFRKLCVIFFAQVHGARLDYPKQYDTKWQGGRNMKEIGPLIIVSCIIYLYCKGKLIGVLTGVKKCIDFSGHICINSCRKRFIVAIALQPVWPSRHAIERAHLLYLEFHLNLCIVRLLRALTFIFAPIKKSAK